MSETTTTTQARAEEAIRDDVYLLILATNPTPANLAEAHNRMNPSLARRALGALQVTPEAITKFKEEWERADQLGLQGNRVEHALGILFEAIRKGTI